MFLYIFNHKNRLFFFKWKNYFDAIWLIISYRISTWWRCSVAVVLQLMMKYLRSLTSEFHHSNDWNTYFEERTLLWNHWFTMDFHYLLSEFNVNFSEILLKKIYSVISGNGDKKDMLIHISICFFLNTIFFLSTLGRSVDFIESHK